MKFPSLFPKFAILTACLLASSLVVVAQPPGSNIPRQEKLLNGLKLLMWSDPSATDVKVRIRIHSGASFDPQGKEGVMQLLADSIFPTPAARTFFTEDLGGSLEVVTNYDYIQINATAKPSEFVTLLETLAQAVSNPSIDKETTAAVKKALAEKLTALEKDPDYAASHAVTKRLFGTFPYGRPQTGSLESLVRIDFADLQVARDRFLSADNATVAISGNFNTDLGFRAARRYLGAWLKSEKRIPSTFRQPDAPYTGPLEIALGGAHARTLFALRGVSRSDADYAAAMVLGNVLRDRLLKSNGTVSNHARVLPGVLIVTLPGTAEFPFSPFSDKISEAEFKNARAQAIADFSTTLIVDQWLDADTYRTTVAGDTQAFQNVTLADVQRVAERLAKNPIASVIVRPAA